MTASSRMMQILNYTATALATATGISPDNILIQRMLDAEALTSLPGIVIGEAAEKNDGSGTNARRDVGYGVCVVYVHKKIATITPEPVEGEEGPPAPIVDESDMTARQAIADYFQDRAAIISPTLSAWRIDVEPGEVNEPAKEGSDEILLSGLILRFYCRV